MDFFCKRQRVSNSYSKKLAVCFGSVQVLECTWPERSWNEPLRFENWTICEATMRRQNRYDLRFYKGEWVSSYESTKLPLKTIHDECSCVVMSLQGAFLAVKFRFHAPRTPASLKHPCLAGWFNTTKHTFAKAVSPLCCHGNAGVSWHGEIVVRTSTATRNFKVVHVFEIRASKTTIFTVEDASHNAAL